MSRTLTTANVHLSGTGHVYTVNKGKPREFVVLASGDGSASIFVGPEDIPALQEALDTIRRVHGVDAVAELPISA